MRKQGYQPLRVKKYIFRDLLFHTFYTLVSAATLGPIIWIFMLSFKTKKEFATNPLSLPRSFFLGNYINAFTDSLLTTFFMNSIIVTSIALALILIISTLAGYSLARIKFSSSRILFMIFVMLDGLPIYILIIPLYVMLNFLKLDNYLWGLIFTYVAMRTGVSIIIMRGFFRSIPSYLEDAAKIDGCNLLQSLWYIMLPIVRPGLTVAAIMNFIFVWNEYYLATILLSKMTLFTVPPGLSCSFMGRYTTNWPAMAAGFTLTIIPTFLVFIFLQDKIIKGWSTIDK